MKHFTYILGILLINFLSIACNNRSSIDPDINSDWNRSDQNPILQDQYLGGGYESASDGHVFYDDHGDLYMIYSGDADGKSSIKLAKGNSMTEWTVEKSLLSEPNTSNLAIHKETAFYRKSKSGKHQIYYIGYPDENTYQSQIFLAEADSLQGPYTQIPQPIVSRGDLAGKSVYSITSPSVMEYNDQLYMSFIGWNDSPQSVSEIWIIGASSQDNGHTWSDFQIVETPIGMEGQVSQKSDSTFVAVRTGEYCDGEAIFYATSQHPFGPWDMVETPIMTKDGSDLEKDEIIAPQITFDKDTDEEYLFYTGADYEKGWWMMLAKRK